MANNKWCLLDVFWYPTPGGFIIIATTDVPCHLYLHWTVKRPWYHKKTIVRRGLTVWGDVRICFVVSKANEQEEEGDTLVHTFIKLNWPICQTRWFMFTATIDKEDTPSNTPVFQLHRWSVDAECLIVEYWTWQAEIPPPMNLVIEEHWSP